MGPAQTKFMFLRTLWETVTIQLILVKTICNTPTHHVLRNYFRFSNILRFQRPISSQVYSSLTGICILSTGITIHTDV